MEYDATMANLNDAVIHFNRKREFGELSVLEQAHINHEFKFAFSYLLDREYDRAQLHVNRANATMNATSH